MFKSSYLCRVKRVVGLDLWEEHHVAGRETPGQVSGAVSGGAGNTVPLLDLGEDEVDHLVEELVGLVAVDGALYTGAVALDDLPLGDAVLDVRGLGAHARDALDHGLGHRHVVLALLGQRHERGNVDALDLGDVAVRNVLLQRQQHVCATRSALRTVLHVRRLVAPVSQSYPLRLVGRTRDLMLVCQCHDVGCDGAVERLLEARQVEGSRYEVTGHGVGRRRRLDRVQRTSVVLWWMIPVSAGEAMVRPLNRCE